MKHQYPDGGFRMRIEAIGPFDINVPFHEFKHREEASLLLYAGLSPCTCWVLCTLTLASISFRVERLQEPPLPLLSWAIEQMHLWYLHVSLLHGGSVYQADASSADP